MHRISIIAITHMDFILYFYIICFECMHTSLCDSFESVGDNDALWRESPAPCGKAAVCHVVRLLFAMWQGCCLPCGKVAVCHVAKLLFAMWQGYCLPCGKVAVCHVLTRLSRLLLAMFLQGYRNWP